MNWDDYELQELVQIIGKWLIAVVIFGGLFTYILITRFGGQEIAINKKINSRHTVIAFVTTSKTKNNNEIKEVLKKYNIKYEIVYKDKERYFKDFLKRIKTYEEDIKEPSIVYIEDGSVIAIIKEINNLDDLVTFIEYNNLSN